MQNTVAKFWVIVALVNIMIWFNGCDRSETLNTEYGRIRGMTGGDSINGTRLLSARFEQRGSRVKRVSIISPRLNQFTTIVWCPDRRQPPSQKEVEGLERWLRQGPDRTLVYIGRDYDAELDYYQQVNGIPEMKMDEEFQRVRAEALVRRLQADADDDGDFLGVPLNFTEDDENECKWFLVEQHARQKGEKFSGSLVQGIDYQLFQLEYSKIFRPVDDIENYGPSKTLLNVDGLPFIHSRKVELKYSPDHSYRRSKLIVVNNGSFLLNFGLINRDHQRLADALIAECLNTSQVTFLESGPDQAPVRDKNEPHQPWAWVTQPPLRYIVPHVLIWAVLLCFALYPIFGRPKRYRPKIGLSHTSIIPDSLNPIQHAQNMQSFRSHLVALASLLQRAEPIEEAKEKIKEFRDEQL